MAEHSYPIIIVRFCRCGKNLGVWGAISADITQANSRLPNGEHKQGQSVRFLYAKSLNELGTNFQLMGYRYSTKGYYTLSETSYKQMSGYNIKTQDGPEFKEAEIIDYHNLYYTKRDSIRSISASSLMVTALYILPAVIRPTGEPVKVISHFSWVLTAAGKISPMA